NDVFCWRGAWILKPKGLLFFSLFLGIMILFQNCGNPFEAGQSQSSFSFCEPQQKQSSPFSQSKLQIPQATIKASQKPGAPAVQAAIVLDMACFKGQSEPLSLFSRPIEPAPNLLNLSKAVVNIEIPSELETQEILDEINSKACLLGLAENLELHKTQVANPINAENLEEDTIPEHNDPFASLQGHLDFLGYERSRFLQDQINQKVVVAIIDTGVDYQHLELNTRMWQDGSGNVGANFAYSFSDDPLDDDGHGTHVAGIIAASQDNNFGVIGLTSDYVEIMAIKALDQDGNGSSAAVANGIQYAIANGADVINLSIEGLGRNTVLEAAIADAVNAGVFVTAAAGNQGQEITNQNLYSPAYIGPSVGGMMSVSSIDTNTLQLSYFSNYSTTFSEIAAPGAENARNNGGGILSTLPNDRFDRIFGTSQATPMISSAGAMIIGYLKTRNVAYTAGAIESFIKSDGAMNHHLLQPYVVDSRVLQLGFLAENLSQYFDSAGNTTFEENATTGNTCQN
ncbi:MAG: S8 family serine peptidase, partial [Pseudomonadota bacterium]